MQYGEYILKICGITSGANLEIIRRFPVTYFGVWYHTNGGTHELSLDQLKELVGIDSGSAQPCLVTLSDDVEHLADVLAQCRIRTVQLHGFVLPPKVSDLRVACRRRGFEVTIIKVLHVRNGRCFEKNLVTAYKLCGTDIFIIDSFAGRDAIGSTGQRVDADAARLLAQHLYPTPALLAGGVDDTLIHRVGQHYAGFDIDSGARENGEISGEKISKLSQSTAPQRIEEYNVS